MISHSTSIKIVMGNPVLPKDLAWIPMRTPIYFNKRSDGKFFVECECDGMQKMSVVSAEDMNKIIGNAVEVAFRQNGKDFIDIPVLYATSGDDFMRNRNKIIRIIKEWWP